MVGGLRPPVYGLRSTDNGERRTENEPVESRIRDGRETMAEVGTGVSDEGTIRRLEGEIITAIKSKNGAALGALVADDFVYRRPGAEESGKAEFIRGILTLPVEITTLDGEQLKVSIFGDIAVLTGVQRATTKSDGREETSAVAFVDVFAKRDGRWQIVLAHGVDLAPESSG